MKTIHPSQGHKGNRASEKGSALVYILIAIALLAALTFTFMEPSSQQTSSQSTFRSASAIQSQAEAIRAALQECVLLHPSGDSTIDTAGGGTDPGAATNYPIKANSTHYTGSTLGAATGRFVRDIRCPGDNTGGGANNHDRIFSGASGKFMPPAPDLFEDWQYYNGPDGVFFWVQTNKSDAFIQTTLEKLDDSYGECEADVIDASGGAINLDSASPAQTQCALGYTCFRIRATVQGSAVYLGDTATDESGC